VRTLRLWGVLGSHSLCDLDNAALITGLHCWMQKLVIYYARPKNWTAVLLSLFRCIIHSKIAVCIEWLINKWARTFLSSTWNIVV
jgi:hypothetical protein